MRKIDFMTHSEAEGSHFRHYEIFLFSALCNFFRKFFQCPQRVLPSIFLVFCNRTNVKKSQRVPLKFFGTMTVKNSHFLSLNFQSLKGSPSIFLKFCKRVHVKKSQGPPFTVFGIVRFINMNKFNLKIMYSQAQLAMSHF